jgi:hypothetical protein
MIHLFSAEVLFSHALLSKCDSPIKEIVELQIIWYSN